MSEYQSLIDFVDQSINSPVTRSKHIACGHVFAYMRVARHAVDGKIVKTLDIGSVESKEDNKGYFTRFLKEVERIAKKHSLVVFVESIQNPHLELMLKRRGYQIEGEPLCPNAWRSMESVDTELSL